MGPGRFSAKAETVGGLRILLVDRGNTGRHRIEPSGKIGGSCNDTAPGTSLKTVKPSSKYSKPTCRINYRALMTDLTGGFPLVRPCKKD